jgi:hypothetical protein
MRAKVVRVMLLVFAGIMSSAIVVSADTLELRDGRVVRGKYLGGSETTIRLEVNGQVQSFEIADVASISFSESSGGTPSNGGTTSNDGPSNSNQGSNQGSNQSSNTQPSNNAQRVTVPAGTRIMVRMIDSVDSSKNKTGDRFRASLETNLEANGVVVAPRGSEVYGRLADAKGAGNLTGHSDLKLELTEIRVNNEMLAVVTGEYELAGKNRGGNTAKKAVGGAAVGAVIGALAGGGKGAAIGAGVGAGAGTTINIVTKGEQVRVPSETLLEFRLDAPLTAPPYSGNAR